MSSLQVTTLDSLFTQYETLTSKLENGGYVFVLQRNPLNLGRISRTTCRLAECAEPDKIFMRTSYRLSLEKSDRARPPNVLGYRAVAPLSIVTKSARGANRGKRGLGANGEEWWCLRCVESLLKAMQQFEFELLPPESQTPVHHALVHWAQWIIPEERAIPRFPGKFRLEAPYRYGVEKWKAVILYNSQQEHGAHFKPELPPHLSTTEPLYTGTDGRSLYVSKGVERYARVDGEWGGGGDFRRGLRECLAYRSVEESW